MLGSFFRKPKGTGAALTAYMFLPHRLIHALKVLLTVLPALVTRFAQGWACRAARRRFVAAGVTAKYKNCRSRPEVMVDFDDRGIVLR
jgi:hypothetical protein